MAHKELSEEMQECISNCLDCHAICTETISHGLAMGGKHASQHHIGLLQDCAQICATTADFMLRQSDFYPQTCAVCANVCEQCATACETVADGDDLMLDCAEACHACAESCRSMSGMSSMATS